MTGPRVTVVRLEAAGLEALGAQITEARARLHDDLMPRAAAAARTARAAGVPITTIAAALNVTRPTVYAWTEQENTA